MKPVRLSLTIELPPDGTEERDQVMRMSLSELLGINAVPGSQFPVARPTGPGRDSQLATRNSQLPRPHQPADDEPTDVNQADLEPSARPADVPADGRQLFDWLRKHRPDAQRAAVSLAKSRGYGTMLTRLDADQAADIYHELTAAGPGPRRGQKWGS